MSSAMFAECYKSPTQAQTQLSSFINAGTCWQTSSSNTAALFHVSYIDTIWNSFGSIELLHFFHHHLPQDTFWQIVSMFLVSESSEVQSHVKIYSWVPSCIASFSEGIGGGNKGLLSFSFCCNYETEKLFVVPTCYTLDASVTRHLRWRHMWYSTKAHGLQLMLIPEDNNNSFFP